jgi:hypothetical protein
MEIENSPVRHGFSKSFWRIVIERPLHHFAAVFREAL